MRALLALALLLAACADAPDDDVSTAGAFDDAPAAEAGALADEVATDDIAEADAIAEVGTAEDALSADLAPAGGGLTVADLEGDWVYCSGNAALDEAATFEGDDVRTYLHDRPAMFATFEVRDGAVAFDDGRTYRASRTGDLLSLTDNDGVSVYAPSPEDCP